MQVLLAGMLFCSPTGVEQSLEVNPDGKFVLYYGEEAPAAALLNPGAVRIVGPNTVLYEGNIFTMEACEGGD